MLEIILKDDIHQISKEECIFSKYTSERLVDIATNCSFKYKIKKEQLSICSIALTLTVTTLYCYQ